MRGIGGVMGWYGHDNITKYYSIGFTEKEQEEITAAFKKYEASGQIPVLRKHTEFIKHFALAAFELEKENQRLKNILKTKNQEAAVAGQNGASEETTWTGYFRDVKRVGSVLYPVWG